MTYHLVYTSHATRPMPLQERLELVRCSARNNARRKITGMLLYKDDRFIQVLEGDRDTVNGLVTFLKSDRRHEGVQVLGEGEHAERHFADWHMRLFNPDRHGDATREAMADWFARAEQGQPISCDELFDVLGNAEMARTG